MNKWLKARGIAPLAWDDLPKHGLIEDDVACGFLCTTDCDTCFLEGFITNAAADAEERNQAINKMVKQLLSLAVAFGYKKIIAVTKDMNLLNRAIHLGFKPSDVFFLAKEIENQPQGRQQYLQ